MALSKPGIISLILGILVVAGVWYFAFPAASIWAVAATTILGGLILFGLFLMLIGVLMLVI